MEQLPIVIDTDIGADDCMAIISLAAEYKDNISFLLSSFGNSTLRATSENLNTLKELVPLPLPVVKGAEKAKNSVPFVPSHDIAFFEYDNTFPKGEEDIIEDKDFTKRLYEHIKQKGSVDYFALGPLTNLALLFEKYPDSTKYINKLVVMGGGIDTGNITKFAEYNIYCDAQSAKEVFENELEIIFVPINVCDLSALNEEECRRLSDGNSRFAKCIELLIRLENELATSLNNPLGIIYDAVATTYYARPDIYKTERIGIDVCVAGDEYGKTSITSKRNNVLYVKDLDKKAYFSYLLSTIKKMQNEYERHEK